MAKQSTRTDFFKKGRRLRKLNEFVYKMQSITQKRVGKEEFIETEYGKIRTLWYGFNNKEKTPVLFTLHGGGFILMHADADEPMNIKFNKSIGCKIISIDYAKAPEYPYPAAVNQIYAVVKHVYENADKYRIDKNIMAIGGHSAGGNLSAVTCLKAKRLGEFKFVCQVLDYPPLDLATSAFNKPQPKGTISPKMAVMFDACYIKPSQAKDPFVSPIYATKEDITGLPPALFILAGGDSLHDEGMKYYKMLQSAGVEVECIEYPKSSHGFTYLQTADSKDAIAKMSAFFAKFLN